MFETQVKNRPITQDKTVIKHNEQQWENKEILQGKDWYSKIQVCQHEWSRIPLETLEYFSFSPPKH